jgi:hypothetical protein
MHVPQTQDGQQIPEGGRDLVQPVFLDRTGRRRRVTVLVGSTIAAGLLVSLALIAMGLFTGTPVLVPGWSGNDTNGHGRAETEVEKLGVASPEPAARDAAVATPGTRTGTATPTPSRTPTPTLSPGPQPTTTVQPGQGGVHRNTPSGRPSKSTGKPS